ncbi:hypothetical protein ACFX1T_021601 [Malus domestica]
MHQDVKELVQKCDRCQHYKPVPVLRATPADESLAVYAVGNRLGNANVTRYWGQRLDDCGNRLLHQMGRSRAYDNHDSGGHRTLHMKEHHLSIWHPSIHRHR